MPKTKISEFDTNPDNNTDINSINIAEGCPPSSINNAIRQLMADLKEFQTGGGGDPFNGAVNGTVGATTPNTGAFTTLSASGAASFNGGVTLGDASGDALTINSSAVSIPNGLNFDSNTFVIDATNNRVGVGIASPTATVHISAPDGTAPLTLNSAGGSDSTRALNFNIAGDNYGKILVPSASGGAMAFWTGGANAAAERVRITNAGDVGIGTTSPTQALSIARGTSAVAYIDLAGGNRTLGTNSFTFGQASDGVATLFQRENAAMFFATNATERMRITSAGNVGIGTSSPNARLSVRNTGAQVDISSSATNVTFESIDRSATTNPVDTLYYTRNGTFQWYNSSYSERMRLDASGNLGLGVTPSAWTSSWRALQTSGLSLASPNTSSLYLGQNWFQGSGGNTYINTAAASFYAQISGSHSWHIAPSGTAGNAITFTQAMTLDASGRLGIGETSPSNPLTISASLGSIRVNSTTGTNSVYAQFSNTGGSFYVGRDSSTASTFGSAAYSSVLYSEGAYPMVFFTSSTERMRIDGSGNLLVGTTSADVGGATRKFAVSSSGGFASAFVNTTAGNETVLVQNADTSGTRRFIVFKVNSGSGTSVGEINSNGTSTTYSTSSDYRLKENIAPMTGALAKVSALKPVTYTWKSTGESSQGFIAHELAEVVPDCVTGEKDAVDADGNPVYQGIDTSFLVATLTAAIQEQQAIINDLKARIETIENKE